MQPDSYQRVSVHGGHSGSFCGHAADTLESIVARYVEMGFTWICLTEHMPPEKSAFVPPEELAEGYSISRLQHRFDDYFVEARRLKSLYQNQIEIFVGFETEAYSGYQGTVARLISRHEPDMIVGSVHHVHDLCIDGDPRDFRTAAQRAGGIEALYCDYFDKQLELIERFQPAVVGHFDLIRMHDSDYPARMEAPKVRDRAFRNLERIKELGLILDLNVRALSRGAPEPYVSAPLMEYSICEDIALVPGDDSHGVASVGSGLDAGIHVLLKRGGHAEWRKPRVGGHMA